MESKQQRLFREKVEKDGLPSVIWVHPESSLYTGYFKELTELGVYVKTNVHLQLDSVLFEWPQAGNVFGDIPFFTNKPFDNEQSNNN